MDGQMDGQINEWMDQRCSQFQRYIDGTRIT